MPKQIEEFLKHCVPCSQRDRSTVFPVSFFFSRCSRRFLNGSGGDGSGSPRSTIVSAAVGCGADVERR